MRLHATMGRGKSIWREKESERERERERKRERERVGARNESFPRFSQNSSTSTLEKRIPHGLPSLLSVPR